ncbi:Na+/H+ antiporter subunit A [Streptomyces sp. TRM 70351]|uniref:Na+/H+ antiporter subunit A n=1 Tax=Streptomyces sp. TRM 70351 TaxID=3116552 RepID=UPI002E7B9885|nr:Na+/H+ antiporter subunit A [Streptomyces sp. TRM 70351]MEE1929541.1 Na+/H+ antiporter subunit A [Streptomyces sp. TRM 70351]
MLILVALHLGVAAVLPPLARRVGRAVWAVAALVPLAALGWALTHTGAVLDGRPVEQSLAWAPALGLTLDVRLDALALLMVGVVTGIGALVLLYSAYYGEHAGPRETGRDAGLLLAFAGVMLGLVVSDHLFLLYAFWELTTIASFLLIAGRDGARERRRAAEQALLTTVAGGLVMLLGFVMLGEAAGTYRVSEILADPPRGGLVPVALVLVLLGAFAKSAQFPLHAWLPAAMVAPTPVSAYLHAAAMVKAGVYLVARLAPGFAEVDPWRPLVLTVGLLTMVLGAWRALRETDLKRLLAFGTISELGMLTALLGAGTRIAALAGAATLLAHALFKSSLFMVVGVVDHQAGTRDLRELSRLGAALPALFTVAALSVASMAKLPPFVGFLGEDAAFEALLHDDITGHGWALAALAVGSVLTVAYTARYLWGAFAGKPGTAATEAARPKAAFVAPAAVTAVLGLAAGLWYSGTGTLTAAYADVFPAAPGGSPYELKLWHGATPALGLAVVTLLAGLALHAARRPVGRFAERLPRLPDAERGYGNAVRGLYRAAVGFTRRTQVGSLPLYLTIALVTVVALPGTALLLSPPPLDGIPTWWSPMEIPLGLAVLTAAAALTVIRHRLAAVLLTGAIGYGVAGLFVVQGAPDLALTQFLVETLTLVVVVLVLRRLPSRFTPGGQPRVGRWVRAAVAVAAGTFVAVFAVVATEARQGPAISTEYLRRVGETGGENVVNAIIVDFRALDTLGEISVLLVTAIGVASLVKVWRGAAVEPASAPPETGPDEAPPPRRVPGEGRARSAARWDEPAERWLPGAHARPGAERSVLMEVVTRLLFPSIMVLSLFLLFSGHYRPGGGFAGGLVAGQAFVLRYLVGGRTDLGRAAPVRPAVLAGGGLVVAAAAGAGPLAFGEPPLTGSTWEVHLPLLGAVHSSTSLYFDVGVYLLVIGVILKLLAASGTSLSQDEDAGKTGSPQTPEGETGEQEAGGRETGVQDTDGRRTGPLGGTP